MEGTAPIKSPRAVSPVAADLSDVVYLLPDGPLSHSGQDLFARELARQAFWLAAREDFGLRVRDSSLGEVPPEGLPGDRQFRLRHSRVKADPFSVEVGPAGAEHRLWQGSLLSFQYSSYPAQSAAYAERLSREFFSKCLTAAGFEARPSRTSDASVPEDVEEALLQTHEMAQFVAVRRLHEEMRARGESNALLAALARGYANLGLLTQFHWNATPMVFNARGLLFAQRLVVRSPGDPSALRVRAYVAVMIGLHSLALSDLDAAAKLAVYPKSLPPPPWVEAADAYVHFDLDRLDAVRARSDTPIVRLFRFLAVAAPRTDAATIRAGRALLETDPECYLAHYEICQIGSVPHLQVATRAALDVFAKALPRHLQKLSGLPREIAKQIDGKLIEPGVYIALNAAGRDAADRGEPSWATLGNLLQEVRFTQYWHRLDFMAEKWAGDLPATPLEAVEVLKGHPFLPLIDSFRFNPHNEPVDVRNRLLAIPAGDLDTKALGVYFRLQRADPVAAREWFRQKSHGHTLLMPDLARQVRTLGSDDRILRGTERFLRQMSPHAPITRALNAIYGEPEVVARLPELEKIYAGHAVVQWGIGQRHLADGRSADAQRCWKRWIALSPDMEAYRKLAGAYLAAGDEVRWLETMEKTLEEEDTGLFHTRVRVDIANYFMGKKEFKRAEPYALAAAESGAAWALHCAAECERGLNKWDEANRFYRAAALGYGQPAFNWYFTCRATGKMDRAAAESAVRGYLRNFGPGTRASELFQAGRFHLLEGNMKEAGTLFDRAAQEDRTDISFLFAALAADAEKDATVRDLALSRTGELDPDKNPLHWFGPQIRKWSAASAAPNSSAVETSLKRLAAGPRADAEFLVGWFLANRGQRDRALGHWKRCAEAEAGLVWVKTHARASLESGLEGGPAKRP